MWKHEPDLKNYGMTEWQRLDTTPEGLRQRKIGLGGRGEDGRRKSIS